MSVADEDVFYRRVRWAKRTTDQRSGKARPSSDSFRDSTDPPSPHVRPPAQRRAGLRPKHPLPGPGDGGGALVEFEVGDLRRHGFEVAASPEEDEPAHAHVAGDTDKRSTRRWAVTPVGET